MGSLKGSRYYHVDVTSDDAVLLSFKVSFSVLIGRLLGRVLLHRRRRLPVRRRGRFLRAAPRALPIHHLLAGLDRGSGLALRLSVAVVAGFSRTRTVMS